MLGGVNDRPTPTGGGGVVVDEVIVGARSSTGGGKKGTEQCRYETDK
jgi:hypothetical protein